MDQFGGELACDAATLRDRSEPQADDAHVDFDRTRRQPAIFARPRVRLDRALESPRDLDRLVAARQIRNEETELVAAEPRVQIASLDLGLALDGEKILRANLIGKDPRDPFDDAIADGVAERIVVPLEAVDIDDAETAP